MYALLDVTHDDLIHDPPNTKDRPAVLWFLVPLLPHGSPFTEIANTRILLAHPLPNFGILPTHIPLVSLFLSFSSLQSLLKLLQ